MNNISQIDLNMTNTTKRITYLRGYGNIFTMNDNNLSNEKKVYNRLQPLCAKYGNHYPKNNIMPESQHTLAWNKSVDQPRCKYQNETLKLNGINSQLPDSLQYQQAMNAYNQTDKMTKTGYFSADGQWHDNNN